MSPSIDLIRQFTDQHAGLIVGYFLINILTLALETVAMSIVLSKIFSSISGEKGFGKDINKWLMIFVGIFVLVRLGYFLRSILYDEIIPQFFYFLRTQLYDKIIDRYRVDFKELNLGYILFNFEHLPSSFKKLMTELLQEYIPNMLALFVCLVYLFWTNKIVGGIVLFGIIVFIIIVALTLSTSVNLSAEEHLAFEYNNEHIQDRLTNLFDIYTSGTETHEKQEYSDKENDLKQSMTDNFKYITMVISIIEVFTILVLAASFYVLHNAYKNKTMKNEQIISTILVLTYFLTYFSKISSNYIGLTDVFGYSRESDRFLREINGTTTSPSPSPPPSNIRAMNMAHGPVEFKNVHFKYPIEGSKPKKVLNGASLYIKPGSKVAIYGKSGSGKSTLIKLLLGFYGPDSGSIMINGMDIKNVPVDELRKNISVVNQNIKLFDKTIFENMTYGIGDETVTEDDIKKIIGNMGVFEGVVDGLDTRVGVSGSMLSGGQKQIVNFVRAILKNAPIVVLDEPTSALDASTKKLVLDIIKKLKGKTVIIITHDKSIMPYVDKVYELIGGKLKMV